jgi:hypothetical protein
MNKNIIIDHACKFGYGGMAKNELAFLYGICENKTVLELGSYIGQSSYVIAHTVKSLTCVDAWDDDYDHLNHDIKQKVEYLNSPELKTNTIFNQFLENCKYFIECNKIHYLKGLTKNVVNNFKENEFDMIIIDADHSYEGVYSDITNYISKLKCDGLLIFHDYGSHKWDGVKQACDQSILENKIKYNTQYGSLGLFTVIGNN